MAHSKYYNRIHKEKNAVIRINKKTIFIIAIALIVIIGVVGVKVNQAIVDRMNEKNKEYGDIHKQNIETQDYDDKGNVIKTKEKVSITVIDVGKGQAIFIDTQNADVLIDGGSAENSSKVLKAIDPYVDGKLEYVINTNSNNNFSGGLPAVFEKYEIDNLIYAKNENKEFHQMMENEKNCKIIKGKEQNISLGDGIMLSIYDKSKDGSNLMCVVKYNNENILLTTSMAREEEEMKIAPELDKVKLYVVGCFGEPSASSAKFLNATNPSYAVISSTGVSGKEVTARMRENNTVLFGTFNGGNFIFEVEGLDMEINFDNKLRVQ